MYDQRDEIRNEIEEGSDNNEVLLRRLNAINKILEEDEEVQDELFDQWERDLAEGKMPDLDAKPGEH